MVKLSTPIKGLVLEISLGHMHMYSTSDTASATVNFSLYLSLTDKLIN